MADPAELRDLALQAGRLVAAEIESAAGQTNGLSTKSSPTDIVTTIDTWAEKEIMNFLNARRPNDEIIGEEGTAVAGSSGVKWIIDPIDGTTNFFYGLPGFTISVGVAINEEIVAGVIIDPTSGEEFAAALNMGATSNGREIRVSSVSDLSQALVATGFSYLAEKRLSQGKILSKVLPEIRDIRRSGSAAYDLSCVASGKVDAYFEQGLNLWDIAAGLIIIKEAGGEVSDLEGNFPTGEYVIAAPSVIHGQLLELLQTLTKNKA